MQINSYFACLPEMILATLGLLLLIIDVFLKPKHKGLTYILTLVTLLLTAYAAVRVSVSGVFFDGHFIVDNLSQVLKATGLVILFMVVMYSRVYVKDRAFPRGEYHVLLLFSGLGMLLLASAHSLLMIYLGLELLSLPLYTLVAMQRDNQQSVEAGIKYFIMGAIASGMLLYGMSLIYGLRQTLLIDEIAIKLLADNQLALFGLVFMLAGVAFKFGLVPFHMWIPDVYQGAPSSVTLLVGTMPKIAAFGMIYRLFAEGLVQLESIWVVYIAILAVLSLAIGNIVAIAQSNVKRMLAYSTISHVGFIMLGFLAGPEVGYGNALYYTLIYALVNTAAFGMITYLSYKGFEFENLNSFKGLAKQSPWLAFMMMLVMFSLAGVPPTAGFYAKFLILTSLIDAGWIELALIAVIFSVIGAFYYLRLIKLMYFDEPSEAVFALKPTMGAIETRTLLSLNGLAVLLFGVFPAPILAICGYALGEALF
jgi:NADH-quinone oxidoreductase subunit N